MKIFSLSVLFILFLPHSSFAQLATPNPAGLAFGHVHLNVSDIEYHKRLWVEHFGGIVIEKGPLTAIKLPNLFLLLTQMAPTMESQATVMDHLGFKVRDMDRFLEKWQVAGFEVDEVFTGAEKQTNAYITLPDGLYVELQEDQALAQEVAGYHLHYYLPEHQALLAWYTNLFELDIKPRGIILTTTNVPGLNLSFANAEIKRNATKGSSVDHIGFEVDDLNAFIKTLEAKGIAMNSPYQDMPAIRLKVAFFTDPAGTLIELTEGLDDY
ncbi:MAG: catechol 2,3-dioxygenase-like lactoylglutathione lyase family enzyme [Pseudohongiellaceae bacterium]